MKITLIANSRQINDKIDVTNMFFLPKWQTIRYGTRFEQEYSRKQKITNKYICRYEKRKNWGNDRKHLPRH